jgi:hypothetical protein
MRTQKTQISKIRTKKGNTKEIQGIKREDFENLYSKKLKNLEEMDKILHICGNPKLIQLDINHLNRSITQNEIEAAIKRLPKKEKSRN